MRKIIPYLFLGCILFAMVSCQKEKSIDSLDGSDGFAEVGSWKLLSMRGITSHTVEYNDGVDDVKTVTTSDYTTINNAGTIKFDGKTMTGTGLTYSVDAIAKTYFYTNGLLDDSLELPFAATIPPTNSTASYKKIGSDSIYVQSGAFTNVGSGGTTQASSGGYKLAFDGDKMTMTAVANQSRIDLSTGISQKVTIYAMQILTLQRQ
jgi:hypothetical protein